MVCQACEMRTGMAAVITATGIVVSGSVSLLGMGRVGNSGRVQVKRPRGPVTEHGQDQDNSDEATQPEHQSFLMSSLFPRTSATCAGSIHATLSCIVSHPGDSQRRFSTACMTFQGRGIPVLITHSNSELDKTDRDDRH